MDEVIQNLKSTNIDKSAKYTEAVAGSRLTGYSRRWKKYLFENTRKEHYLGH